MKKILPFFILAYTITWGFWILMVMANPQIKYFHLLGSWGPSLAAIILTYRSEGWMGLRTWWGNIFHIASTRWLVAAAVSPFILYYGSLYFSRFILGEQVIISSTFHSTEFAELGMLSVLTSIMFYGFGEQIGWRGYALPKLIENGYNNITASLVLSVFWAIWHGPLFFYHFSHYSEMSFALVMGWYFSLLLSSFLLTWIYNSSGKSVATVALFHGLIDVIVLMPTLNGTSAMIIINIVLMLAGGITLLTGSKLSSGKQT